MKKLHLILLLTFLPLLMVAQSSESVALYAKGKDLYNAGDYKKAAETFIEVLKLDKAEAPENYFNVDVIKGWIASSYYKAGDVVSACEYDRYYYELPPVDREALTKIYDCSVRLAATHDLDVAVPLLERSLKLVTEILGSDNQFVKDIYSVLVDYEFSRGNISASIDYNEKLKETNRVLAPRVTTKGWDADSHLYDAIMSKANGDVEKAKRETDAAWQIVKNEFTGQSYIYKETFGMLMRNYIDTRDYDSASKLTAEVEEAYRALEGDDAANAAPIVIYIIEYYLNVMRYNEALALAEYAIDMVSDEYGRALLSKNIGTAYMGLEKWIEAKKQFLGCLNVFIGQGRENEVALSYFGLGRCNIELHDFAEAKQCYHQALKIFSKDKDKFAQPYYQTLSSLAATESRMGKIDSALGLIAEAQDFMNNHSQYFTNIEKAFLLKEEGVYLLKKNENAKALGKLYESVNLYEQDGAQMNNGFIEAAMELLSLLLADESKSAEAKALQQYLFDICEDKDKVANTMKLKIYNGIYIVLMKRMHFAEALEINEKLLSFAALSHDFNTDDARINRLLLMIILGNKDKARTELEPMLHSALDCYGKYSTQYLTALSLAGFYIDQTGDLSHLDMAAAYGHDMIDIAGKIYGINDPARFANTINGAKLLVNTEPKAAADIILEALKNTPRNILESDRTSVVSAYTTLATITNNLWIMNEAVDYIVKAIEFIGDGTNIENPTGTYALAGIIYTRLNRLAEAERVLLQAVDYMNRHFGTDILSNTMLVYSSLAELYSKMGQSTAAAEYREKGSRFQKERYGDNKTLALIRLVQNLWPKYRRGDKDGCLADIDELEEIISSMGYMHNVDLLMPSRMKALYYLYEGDIDLACSLADIFSSRSFNYNDRLVAAKIYSTAGKYAEALENADAAIGIGESLHGKKSVSLIEPIVYSAEAKMMLGDKAGAIDNYRRAYNIGRDYISDNILTLTAAQRADFWNSNFDFYRSTLPHVTATRLRDTKMNGLLYDAMLFSNGLLFTADKSIADIVQKSPEDVHRIYSDWMFKKDLLKRLVAQSEAATTESQTEDFKRNIAEVSGEVSTLERQLLDRIGETTGNDWRLPKTTWQQVRKALPRGAAAIEFVDYNLGDSVSALIALVLTRDSKQPVLREICKGDHAFMTNELMFANRDFTDKFFKTFADDIAGCTSVYFVPQGALCSVALESLPVSDGILPSKPEFYRLTSTRELVRSRRGKGKDKSATIYGGLKYDMDVDSMVADAGRYPELRERGFNADNLLSARVSRKGDVVIPELKGALVEVEAVSDFYKKVTGHTPLLRTGADGTESSIKALSGRYGSIFHISTHGFFVADDRQADNLALSQSETLTAEDIALERSGLLMAGAANRYLGLDDIPSDIDDGILTAAEIARLNLENVDLAVLSACETGLGQVTGDGVFGLQRGFKKAGVNSILMSLWKVDDDATCRLITEFYRHWLGDSAAGIAASDKHSALERAKQIVRETPGWENPRYWGAFILLDAID